MREWIGAAAVCTNDQGDLLMIQNDKEKWAVPSGEVEKDETPEMCCIREVKEETGYDVAIEKPLFVKDQDVNGVHVTTYYYEVNVVGGMISLSKSEQDVTEIEWKTVEEVEAVVHAYPEDASYLTNFLYEKTP
ncbi:NUDIX hydrolase [Pseudalkalibacillus hwajinpoensis]|uniref:NUDIX hydrolase n=1 Tax=Guptibacillus hwajinpoensis TaxID=208199 RepID=UPI001CD294D7|nr:NUDIX hydrolase [Pseudalkalibacillus hwajinpoensis]MCA0992221.1 NUDIX hydrolase [Pseudalkalibacillus hwajinpoensis]